jgi:hypothetical protein
MCAPRELPPVKHYLGIFVLLCEVLHNYKSINLHVLHLLFMRNGQGNEL